MPEDSQERSRAAEALVRYHERSTHRLGRFAPGPGHLDWSNQPEPFRRYDGAPTVELPLAGDSLSATWGDLHRAEGPPTRPLDRTTLGALLEMALGVTAWKEAGAARWALRANPSSGNLHPTEGYVLLPGRPGVPAGLYHYRSVDHVIECRLSLGAAASDRLAGWLPDGGFFVGLTSIHWREAWKYGERAFRYCQHDAGHALATVRYAAAILGWDARLLGAPGDDDVATILGLDRPEDQDAVAPPDREHPDALCLVGPRPLDRGAVTRAEGALDDLARLVASGRWAGHPNRLSPEHVTWREIDAAAEASHKPRTRGDGQTLPGDPLTLETPESPQRAVSLVRQRRSAVAMDGHTAVTAGAFLDTLRRLLPRAGVPPWDVLPWRPRVHPVFFVHRVADLPPGLYVLVRDPDAEEGIRASFRSDLLWARPDAVPSSIPLFQLEEGDARSFARTASCQQAIASDSAYSLGMLSVFEPSLRDGPWWYRRLFWESGVLGQVLYMEAEAHGQRGTGIGCYFDDIVHEVLGVRDWHLRDLYHFTVGGAVEDTRLATRPAYPEPIRARS